MVLFSLGRAHPLVRLILGRLAVILALGALGLVPSLV